MQTITPTQNHTCDFFSYEVIAAILALDYIHKLPAHKAAGLRKISAHTGLSGTRMLSIMRTLRQMECVEFSMEEPAGYSINPSALNKSLRQLVATVDREVRIGSKSYKDPRVNIERLCPSACNAIGHLRSRIMDALEIPLGEFLGMAGVRPPVGDAATRRRGEKTHSDQHLYSMISNL